MAASQGENSRFFDIMQYLGLDDTQAIKIFRFMEGNGESLEALVPELKDIASEEKDA